MAQKEFKMRWLIYFFLIIGFITPVSYAESLYVLPYPSFMPGSPFHKVNLIKEEILKYWYFGNFGQFIYNLKQSDKYIVEAKTLFEYKQYLLGHQALKKSDGFFSMAPFYLERAKQEGKNIDQKKEFFSQSATKHIEVLIRMQSVVPQHFAWKPEKDNPTDLALWEAIQHSISIRDRLMKNE